MINIIEEIIAIRNTIGFYNDEYKICNHVSTYKDMKYYPSNEEFFRKKEIIEKLFECSSVQERIKNYKELVAQLIGKGEITTKNTNLFEYGIYLDISNSFEKNVKILDLFFDYIYDQTKHKFITLPAILIRQDDTEAELKEFIVLEFPYDIEASEVKMNLITHI